MAASSKPLHHRLRSFPTPAIFAASVAIAVVLLWRQGALGDVASAAHAADPRLLAGGAALYLVSLALLAFRWHLIVVMVGGTHATLRAAEAFLTSVVINYAAPIGLAIPGRAALTKRALGLTPAQTASAAIWEVGVDVLVLSVLSGIWIVGGLGEALHAADAVAPLAVIGVAAIAVAVGGLLGLALLRRLRPVFWARLRFEAIAFLRIPHDNRAGAARVVASTVVYWALQLVVLGLFLRATGVDPDLRLVLGLVSLPLLIGMLSPVPGGAGVREALMVAIAGVVAADSAAVLLAALVYRVALFAALPVLYLAIRLRLRGNAAPIATDTLD